MRRSQKKQMSLLIAALLIILITVIVIIVSNKKPNYIINIDAEQVSKDNGELDITFFLKEVFPNW